MIRVGFDSMFDPAGNGFDIDDMAQIIAMIVAVAGIMAGLLRWHAAHTAQARVREREEMERRIKDAIADSTRQIQPGYRNGGESLADISMQNKILMERQVDVIKDVRSIRERLDGHIEWHVEKGDG